MKPAAQENATRFIFRSVLAVLLAAGAFKWTPGRLGLVVVLDLEGCLGRPAAKLAA